MLTMCRQRLIGADKPAHCPERGSSHSKAEGGSYSASQPSEKRRAAQTFSIRSGAR